MKTRTILYTTALSLAGGMIASAVSYTLATGGNMDGNGWIDDADGVTTGEPGSGDTGLIAGDGNYNSANWNTLGAVITMNSGDINGTGTSQNFNYSGGGSFTMNGGTFNSRGILANNTDVNLLGGTWTVGNLTNGSGVGSGNGGTLTIGGSFVMMNSRAAAHSYQTGDVVFQTGWTGSWENDTIDLAAWKAELILGNYFLDGTVIDATVFDDNFQVVGNTLSLIPVPEPSSTALLGLGGLALILRRRK